MRVVTKDYRDIKCKFVEFNKDGLTVKICHWDDTEEEIEISNISYISLS